MPSFFILERKVLECRPSKFGSTSRALDFAMRPLQRTHNMLTLECFEGHVLGARSCDRLAD